MGSILVLSGCATGLSETTSTDVDQSPAQSTQPTHSAPPADGYDGAGAADEADGADSAQSSPAQPGAAQPGAAAEINAMLDDLAVKGRAPKTGYERKQFGQRWSDDVPVALGHNGCDTRNDILRRDLTNIQFKPNTRDCVVLSGILVDPYTGATIQFQRGNTTSREVQIDHVVAMADAWQKGAQQLDAATRQSFANDPLNLLAVDGTANQQKGAGDAATWQPSNAQFRCRYAARQVAVKHRYQLWVTEAERAALERWLGTCGPMDAAALDSIVAGAEAAPVN
ncbi:HNH endonuclease family protein [Corynebacterium sp. TAE3-ERU12]|nr:HNH endonuclease family protein [Corynebacterium sp. TAE3-ERU12]